MPSTPRVRVYIACSLDGFIAGPDDDLSWLPGADGSADDVAADPGGLGFEAFMAEVGALLMGRRTYEVAAGFGGAWPYGDRPVLVATRRSLEAAQPTVRAVSGSIEELIAEARAAAGERDVYLDGGNMIRQALDAGLVDELVVTLVPVVLGEGAPLFAGVAQRRRFELVEQCRFGGQMVQLVLRPG